MASHRCSGERKLNENICDAWYFPKATSACFMKVRTRAWWISLDALHHSNDLWNLYKTFTIPTYSVKADVVSPVLMRPQMRSESPTKNGDILWTELKTEASIILRTLSSLSNPMNRWKLPPFEKLILSPFHGASSAQYYKSLFGVWSAVCITARKDFFAFVWVSNWTG